MKDHVGVPLDWSTRHILFHQRRLHPEVAARALAIRGAGSTGISGVRYRFSRVSGTRIARSARDSVQLRRAGEDRLGDVAGAGHRPPVTGGMAIGESPAKYSFTATVTTVAPTTSSFTRSEQRRARPRPISVAFNNLYTWERLHLPARSGRRRPQLPTLTSQLSCGRMNRRPSPSYLSPTLSLDGKKSRLHRKLHAPMFDVLTSGGWPGNRRDPSGRAR